MKAHHSPLRARLALLVILGGLTGIFIVQARQRGADASQPPQLPKAKTVWTVEDAIAQLRLHPRDPYLQYVALQLAKREDKVEQAAAAIEEICFEGRWERRFDRARRVDLFNIFTGALAVQESLQLDTMRGLDPNARPGFDDLQPPGIPGGPPKDAVPPGREIKNPPPKKVKIVDINDLKGPTIKSHPWEKMLAGRNPKVSRLSNCVPLDHYYVEFQSLSKLLQLMDEGDLWSLHLFTQTTKEARTHNKGDRLRQQLAIESSGLLRPLYDRIVEEVAVAGSDLFVSEGSDVTLLFQLKQPALFKLRMNGFLTKAQKLPGAKRSQGKYLGIDYVHVTAPERKVHVFSAYPRKDLHIRSNSKAALFRMLEAIEGKAPNGKKIERLGESNEFKYIRTLMPRGAKEEDGFVYLSDPFIRNIVGPRLKLTERRRMLCYNHLRMIGHAALLYRTERGQWPKSLDDLHKAKCCPGPFNQGKLKCYDGGAYALSENGEQGVCSHHGHAHNLTPCTELKLATVTDSEAKEYKAFLEEYNSYWRTFFDPIAIRIKVEPKEYRLETIVLPLINNSIYTGLASALNGTAEKLDSLPVPKRNILTIGARFNKEKLIDRDIIRAEKQLRQEIARELGIPQKDAARLDLLNLVQNGIGNQLALNIYDNAPMFDLDTLNFLGQVLGSFNRWDRLGSSEVILSFLVSALNSPVYISVPVKDQKIIDDFLKQLDQVIAVLARQRSGVGGWFSFSQDFYRVRLDKDTLMRGYGLSLGPVKWRFFWARIGNGFYIASKPFILKDILALSKGEAKPGAARAQEGPAHAMLKMRAKNWNGVLEDYRLAWAENARIACLNNMGPLSSVGRAIRNNGSDTPNDLGKKAWDLANQFHAVRFFCPEGGTYQLNDKRVCTCTIHGGADSPLQPLEPSRQNSTAKTLENLQEVTASLTFLEDGLHAVMTIQRK